ncbi:hypothetical protein CDD83_10954 [Cordyceps sp. RAO-2017]|nr:hypothetical protein CDD83_10954 [Cordyceps sp. RAO-2017]
MASAASKVGGLAVAVRLLTPLALGSAGYAAWRVHWRAVLRSFVTGPGRSSRILLLLFLVLNWKNLPFAWTYRVFYAIIYHNALRKSPQQTPRALFKPVVPTRPTSPTSTCRAPTSSATCAGPASAGCSATSRAGRCWTRRRAGPCAAPSASCWAPRPAASSARSAPTAATSCGRACWPGTASGCTS